MKTKILLRVRYGCLALVLFMAGVGMVSAASLGVVKGKVIDQTKHPVEFATAALLNAKTNKLITGSISNDKGEFEIDKVPFGEYKLAISMIGYQKVETESFSLNSGNHMVIEKQIVLNESTQQLAEATITARRKFIEQKADKMVINPEASITTSSDNVFDILKQLPGVSVDNNDNISLKGRQGVIVMIDDKPTYLSADQLANFLKGMQGKDVDRIEIIQNPSARYDAEGNSGIINIKTKHNKAPGFNGSVFGGLSIANQLGENGGIDLNMHTGKFNFYGNYSFYEWRGWHTLDVARQYTTGVNQDGFQQVHSFSRYHGNSHNFKIGADYYINKNQVFSVMFRGSTGFNNSPGYTKDAFLNAHQQLDSTLNTTLAMDDRWQNYTYNANYKWDIDSTGQSLTIDADYAKYLYNSNNTQSSDYYNADGVALNRNFSMIGLQKSVINIFTSKVDYVYPVSKAITIESGLKTSFVSNDNRTDFNVDDPTGIIWNNGLQQHDRFIYNENINAAYISGKGQFGKTSAQLGFRVENTNAKGNSESLHEINWQHYTNLFPSLFVQQSFNQNNQLGFSYSYRIGRPSYDMLNPFLWILDPYTYQQGNPFLKPQFTHALGLNYTYKNRWITSLGYNYTRDLFTQVLQQNDQTNAVYQTDQNLSKEVDFNASETAQLDLTKWWHMNGTVIGMYERIVSNVAGATTFARWSYSGNLSNTFSLPKDWSMELNGQYQSTQLHGNFIILSEYQVNAGIQKHLLDNKATLKLTVNDIFNHNYSTAIVRYGSINMTALNHWSGRRVNVSFSYQFGKDNFKTRANRSTSSSEEEQRSAK
ncbi:outer membrane beta-barrel protein [Microbacter margulisiae]|uniref:Outer membrane protein beta-barrel domain-containing protein n=1 Tax=Microbacter margulisiae TaxID=1350067 RepID=A0A7W5H1Z2_9PORP|nr:outer membrane beta-barrel protein [Microbacter margulisiae]MBB3186891.1 hypothetical protein [Microbacter margulisiae]